VEKDYNRNKGHLQNMRSHLGQTCDDPLRPVFVRCGLPWRRVKSAGSTGMGETKGSTRRLEKQFALIVPEWSMAPVV